MKRKLLGLFAIATMLACVPLNSAEAVGRDGGHSHRGGGRGHGFGRGFGIAVDNGGDYGWDVAELYRQLYNNLPYFALHPPVYYSTPVPRTYGYSPFAYPPDVMTPDVVEESKPVTINNPYVPAAPAEPKTDRAASNSISPEPLVIVNPFVTTANIAKSGS